MIRQDKESKKQRMISPGIKLTTRGDQMSSKRFRVNLRFKKQQNMLLLKNKLNPLTRQPTRK